MAGIAYLVILGVQALRSAWAGRCAPLDGDDATPRRRAAVTGWRQGFLSNITNPKLLVFYLAVLPQFLGSQAQPEALLLFALSHALLSLLYLLVLGVCLHPARRVLSRRTVRRSLDAATVTALLGFSARLATEPA